jgi:hypothetical protein
MKGSTEHLEGARLWYFLYVCDHHFSIAYGRPPVIHYDAAISGRQKFLQLPGITQADLRLQSQVAIFVILTDIYNTFGPDIEQTLTDDELNQLRHFNVSLDGWRSKWEQPLGKNSNVILPCVFPNFLIVAPNPYIGDYPSKGVGLHWHFAKLQLNSLALRGCQQSSLYVLSPERRELANIAISSATAILRLVLDAPSVRNALVGIPLYLHTMISYSSVFLMKVHQNWNPHQLGTDSTAICNLVSQIIELLNQGRASDRHITYHIASGLRKMLERFKEWEAHNSQALAKAVPTPNEAQDPESMGVYAANNGIYEMGRDYTPQPQPGFYQQPLELYDFPIGFFDVYSSYLPE